MGKNATVLKLEQTQRARAKKRESRSGRFSTRDIYRAATVKTGTGPARSTDQPGLPPIVKSQPGMAEDYHCRLGPKQIGRIRLTRKSDDHFWIDWVFVPPGHRDTGLGRRLMAAVLADADALGVRLSLEARACAGISQEKLERWYASMGFERTPFRGSLGLVMVRRPAARSRLRRAG